jgi:hypothetical protein
MSENDHRERGTLPFYRAKAADFDDVSIRATDINLRMQAAQAAALYALCAEFVIARNDMNQRLNELIGALRRMP